MPKYKTENEELRFTPYDFLEISRTYQYPHAGQTETVASHAFIRAALLNEALTYHMSLPVPAGAVLNLMRASLFYRTGKSNENVKENSAVMQSLALASVLLDVNIKNLNEIIKIIDIVVTLCEISPALTHRNETEILRMRGEYLKFKHLLNTDKTLNQMERAMRNAVIFVSDTLLTQE